MHSEPSYSHPSLPGTSEILSWTIHLEPRTADFVIIDLMFNREVLIGLDEQSPASDTLAALSARDLGVSRQHARLEIINSSLYITDLDSTNHTRVNGEVIDPNMPYPLKDNDIISLGDLDLAVSIQQGIKEGSGYLELPEGFSHVLADIAKSMTSQLHLDDVLRTLLTNALRLVPASEVTVWLLNARTDILNLEAQIGLDDEAISRLSIPTDNPLVSAAFLTGRPVRGSRESEGQAVKINTGYLVEAVLYVPLIHNGEKLGVLAAAQRQPGVQFSTKDETILETLSDFAAIAIVNARLYEKVQQSDTIKSEMIQNISHEFRTPLAYIIGYLGFLAEDPDLVDTNPALAEHLNQVQTQANRLKWLLDNFNALQLTTDTHYALESIDLGEVVQRAVIMMKTKAANEGVTLTLTVEPGLDPVYAEAAAIVQVVENILANAVKFTPEDGTVEVTVGHSEAMQQAMVSIVDTGIGIHSANHDRVFEPFYQVDGSVSRRYSGVGLGLTVSKHIIEGHGGLIWLESELEQGTSVTFIIPYDREKLYA